jgi:transcriptional regulator with XRE-family HTH domain
LIRVGRTDSTENAVDAGQWLGARRIGLKKKQAEFNLGEHLRTLRQRQGLSQRELARRAGLTNGTVSLIEQNEISPSVASLRKLLNAFPMSLSEFFSLKPPPEDQIFFNANELPEISGKLHAKNGKISMRQIGGSRSQKLQLLLERYSPGADTGEAMLQHDGEEAGIILRGRIEITVGNRKQVLTRGCAYLYDSRLPHRCRNIGKEECVLISACTPPYL